MSAPVFLGITPDLGFTQQVSDRWDADAPLVIQLVKSKDSMLTLTITFLSSF